MQLTKTFFFDAAHHLPNYLGKCKNIHGHRWQVDVTVSGEKNKHTGMVIDFSKLTQIIENYIETYYDHHNLNDVLINPTAENLAEVFFGDIKKLLPSDITLNSISIYESPTSKVTYP